MNWTCQNIFSFQFTHLGAFGGTSVPQTTRLICEAMISSDFAKISNWKGKNGKVAFSRFKNVTKLIQCKKRYIISHFTNRLRYFNLNFHILVYMYNLHVSGQIQLELLIFGSNLSFTFYWITIFVKNMPIWVKIYF